VLCGGVPVCVPVQLGVVRDLVAAAVLWVEVCGVLRARGGGGVMSNENKHISDCAALRLCCCAPP
jgi:hypothetical protein